MERSISFSVLFNFRDVGGYAGLDGRPVRWRTLFRSDSLHRVGDADKVAFAALGLRTVVDLRRADEILRDGRISEQHGLRYHHIHPEHAEWREIALVERPSVPRWLADRYLELARDGGAGLARALGVIADAHAAPLVVHCVAGKDRTGVLCALALSLLGVADEDIAADYALTSAATQRFVTWLRESDPDRANLPPVFMASPAEAMLLFLRELRERHGSVERYITAAGLRADQITAMRAHLLGA